jgi:hypothetical protein
MRARTAVTSGFWSAISTHDVSGQRNGHPLHSIALSIQKTLKLVSLPSRQKRISKRRRPNRKSVRLKALKSNNQINDMIVFDSI